MGAVQLKQTFPDWVIYTLSIPHATSQDSGTYECSVTHEFSREVRVSSVSVTVFGRSSGNLFNEFLAELQQCEYTLTPLIYTHLIQIYYSHHHSAKNVMVSHMCTRCFERCVEVIFYHPTVKLHLCFQHQLLCFMGWLQQMCVRPSLHLKPSVSICASL